MSNTAVDTDVLIVGAGPVGLFLANECARRNLRYRIVESQATQSKHSKALAIFPRTLEVFDMAGLVDPFMERANRVTSAKIVTHGRQLAEITFRPDETPYSFVAMVPQDVTEQLLVEALRRRRGTVEYQTTFLFADLHEDYVTATLQRNGLSEQVKASFVIGCDGAHSAVRHLLNFPFEGAQYDASFLLADVETNTTLPADEMHLCPHESGALAVFPMSATRRRIVAMIDEPEGDVPSLPLVQKLIRERAPKGLEASQLHWSSYFRIHHRLVSRLRQHRVFLAGDAAHIHSPFGGQGMNTGLQDAWNLAWKLDLYLRGLGNEELLDSYTSERLPVIRHVISVTDAMTKIMGTPNRFAQAMRNTVIPVVSRLAPFQHAFVQTLSELGVAYPDSPIVEGPGKRYFDETIRGGDGIRDRYLLFLDESISPSMKEAAATLCSVFGDLIERRPTRETGFKLVRPDGYIAGEGESSSDLLALGSLLDRQITPRTKVETLAS
jgi:2-polyprenyl-6-methoxyphenol hydroxylase-like FAD-dependent oxidoreductase